MNLVRWSPFEEIRLLQNRMSRPFDSLLQGYRAAKYSAKSWNPAVGFHESDNKVVVHIDLPGVDEATVEARVENNILTIRGERRVHETYDKETLRPVEDGAFARSFALATAVDSTTVCATYKAGILTITLPKAQTPSQKSSGSLLPHQYEFIPKTSLRRSNLCVRKEVFHMKRMMLATATTVFFAFSTWVAQATVQTKDSFSWSAELVALDESSKTLTVKASGFGEHLAGDFGRLKAGERIMLRWSGYDTYADSIVRGLRAEEVKAADKFVFPVEFVSFDADRKYITFKVVVPETSLPSIKMLKPGEWVTATSPHGPTARTTPISTVRPYVISSSTSK